MKTTPRPIAILFMLTLLHFTATAQDSPHFSDVVRTYFSRYVPGQELPSMIVFQKKKEGWFTAIEDRTNPGTYTHTELFWSAQKRDYQPLEYSPVSDTSAAAVGGAIKRYYDLCGYDKFLEYQYERNIYFGYASWARDIIQDFGAMEILKDTLLESLARAYTHHAADFFSGPAPDAPARDSFLANEIKAIDTYRRLLRQQPHYSTIVGNIRVKYADECMYAYTLCRYNGYEKDAQQFLQPDCYPDSLLQAARAYFSTIKKEGILITFEDNDTYPIWYLQQVKGYRTDVTVLNYSLLGEPKYLAMLDRHYSGRLFRTRAGTYLKENFYYARFDDMNICNGPVPLGPFLDSVNTSDRVTEEKDGDRTSWYSDSVRRFHCQKVLVPLRQGSLRIRLNDFLLMTDFMLLDILNTNIAKHDFYFSMKDRCWLFEKHLRPSGKVFEPAP